MEGLIIFAIVGVLEFPPSESYKHTCLGVAHYHKFMVWFAQTHNAQSLSYKQKMQKNYHQHHNFGLTWLPAFTNFDLEQKRKLNFESW